MTESRLMVARGWRQGGRKSTRVDPGYLSAGNVVHLDHSDGDTTL